jgi:hypothetical protein
LTVEMNLEKVDGRRERPTDAYAVFADQLAERRESKTKLLAGE